MSDEKYRIIILSRKEREKFEDNYENYPEVIQQIYIAGTDYNGGRRMIFDAAHAGYIKEIKLKYEGVKNEYISLRH